MILDFKEMRLILYKCKVVTYFHVKIKKIKYFHKNIFKHIISDLIVYVLSIIITKETKINERHTLQIDI